LRLANYYRQFVKDFASIARLLYNLVKKIRSETGQRNRKRYLKERFTKELLAVPDLDKNKNGS